MKNTKILLIADYFDIGLAPKVCYIHFNYLNINANDFPDKVSAFFIEPAIFMNFGYKFVKLSLFGDISTPLSENVQFAYQPLVIGLGLYFNFSFLKPGDE